MITRQPTCKRVGDGWWGGGYPWVLWRDAPARMRESVVLDCLAWRDISSHVLGNTSIQCNSMQQTRAPGSKILLYSSNKPTSHRKTKEINDRNGPHRTSLRRLEEGLLLGREKNAASTSIIGQFRVVHNPVCRRRRQGRHRACIDI